jgi:hypothetical protein
MRTVLHGCSVASVRWAQRQIGRVVTAIEVRLRRYEYDLLTEKFPQECPARLVVMMSGFCA